MAETAIVINASDRFLPNGGKTTVVATMKPSWGLCYCVIKAILRGRMLRLKYTFDSTCTQEQTP